MRWRWRNGYDKFLSLTFGQIPADCLCENARHKCGFSERRCSFGTRRLRSSPWVCQQRTWPHHPQLMHSQVYEVVAKHVGRFSLHWEILVVGIPCMGRFVATGGPGRAKKTAIAWLLTCVAAPPPPCPQLQCWPALHRSGRCEKKSHLCKRRGRQVGCRNIEIGLAKGSLYQHSCIAMAVFFARPGIR